MLSIRSRPLVLAAALVALVVSAEACAARGARNRTRVAALVVGDSAVSLSQAESTLYAANVYQKPKHDELDTIVLRILYGARAFERAAMGWQDGNVTPAAVEAARVALLAALSDFEKAIPPGAGPLTIAVTGVRAALDSVRIAELELEGDAVNAQGLPPGAMGILAIFNLIGALLQSGRSSFERIKNALKAEGATDEELAALDVRLTSEIDRREDEAAARRVYTSDQQ